MLRTSTAADLLKDVYKKDNTNMMANSKKALLGAVVLTRWATMGTKMKKTIPPS